MIGSVRRYNLVGRWGKIVGREDRCEYFCHVDELIDVLHLEPGQRVTFTPTWAADGLRAVAVRPIEPAPLLA